jgi:hypothetical protein
MRYSSSFWAADPTLAFHYLNLLREKSSIGGPPTSSGTTSMMDTSFSSSAAALSASGDWHSQRFVAGVVDLLGAASVHDLEALVGTAAPSGTIRSGVLHTYLSEASASWLVAQAASHAHDTGRHADSARLFALGGRADDAASVLMRLLARVTPRHTSDRERQVGRRRDMCVVFL